MKPTTISLRRDIRSLTLPIFIEMLLVALMGATDTFMLSQYADEAVAAVGVANQIITFAFLIFQIINLGTTVLCSQYLGAGNRFKMEQVTAMALLLNILSGAVISVILSVGAPLLLGWMGLKPDLMQYGLPYMQIAGAFAFFQALHLTVSASLRADHKAIYPMLVVVLVNVVNIVGNYGLIFGHFGLPAMGVEGAAIATNISRGVAAFTLFIILFMFRKFRNLGVNFPSEAIARHPVRVTLRTKCRRTSLNFRNFSINFTKVQQTSEKSKKTRVFICISELQLSE